MYKCLFGIVFLSLGALNAADLTQEVAKVDLLIEMTQKSLEGEKTLRDQLLAYQQAHKSYYKNTDDSENLIKLVKAGHRLLQTIKEMNLVQTFDPDFISELTVLSQVATKKSVPRS